MTRILIVDDEPLIREALGTFLADEGYVVETAADGRQALTLIAASAPDLVITDMMMPRLTGWDLLTEVRHQFPFLPVILLSAVERRVPPQGAQLPDHAVFLRKPFDLEMLLSLVTRLTNS